MRYVIEADRSEGVVIIEIDLDESDRADGTLKKAIRGMAHVGTPTSGLVFKILDGDDVPTPILRFEDSGTFVDLLPIDPWETDHYAYDSVRPKRVLGALAEPEQGGFR